MDRKWFLKLLSAGSIGSVLGATSGSIKDAYDREIIKPAPISEGDTIGLISPGMILPEKEHYDEIIEQIQKLGFQVKEGPNARKQYGYLAGTDQERADDLNAMFADDSVDAIMPFRGGWGCNRILHLIDFDLIQKNPKAIIGFSDITTLLLAIFAKTGLVTFHGPVGKTEWTDFTTDHFSKTLSGEPLTAMDIPQEKLSEDYNQLSVISPGKTTGKLLGGNLSVLTAMMGSDYLPDWNNSILFLEDVGESNYRIDRMLTQLKLNGVLDQISGFVFGQCTGCEKSGDNSLSLQQVFDDHIKPLDIPAFSGAMFGHIDHTITLPVGVKATIWADKGSIQLNENVTT